MPTPNWFNGQKALRPYSINDKNSFVECMRRPIPSNHPQKRSIYKFYDGLGTQLFKKAKQQDNQLSELDLVTGVNEYIGTYNGVLLSGKDKKMNRSTFVTLAPHRQAQKCATYQGDKPLVPRFFKLK